jgi:hypothetical protein
MTPKEHVAKWSRLINEERATGQASTELEAQIFLRALDGGGRPALITASDDKDYAIKGECLAYESFALVTERLVGLTGNKIGAPVPPVQLVRVSQELIDNQQEMSHFKAGIFHGSAWVDDCEDSRDILHVNVDENRQRFASLAILFGFLYPCDLQFLYETHSNRLVWSADHGMFELPSGSDVAKLLAMPPAEPFEKIVTGASLSFSDLSDACKNLDALTDRAIAGIVISLPDEWEVDDMRRAWYCILIAKCRDELKSRYTLARNKSWSPFTA